MLIIELGELENLRKGLEVIFSKEQNGSVVLTLFSLLINCFNIKYQWLNKVTPQGIGDKCLDCWDQPIFSEDFNHKQF